MSTPAPRPGPVGTPGDGPDDGPGGDGPAGEPAGAVRHAGVLGSPIGHSRSPVLHRAAYAALGLRWTYEAIECDEAALPGVLAGRGDWAGFSCTMPLKRALLQVAEESSELARRIGAANTLLPRPGGGWLADNTDVYGIVAALREHRITPASVCLLGAGGTASAAVAALADLGVTGCAVLVREPQRARGLRVTAAGLGVDVRVGLLDVTAPELDADLVLSTLPAGAADTVAGRTWRPGQAVFDVVYEPWPTPLAAAAQATGARVIGGALMLLHQAAEQVRLMTGRAAPVAAMRAALAGTGVLDAQG